MSFRSRACSSQARTVSKQQPLKGLVADQGRFLLGQEELDEVFRRDVPFDLVGLEEQALEDRPSFPDIVGLFNLDDAHVLQEKFVQRVEEVVGDVEAQGERAQTGELCQFGRVHLAFFRHGDEDVLVFVDDFLVLVKFVHPVDLDAFLLVGDDVIFERQLVQFRMRLGGQRFVRRIKPVEGIEILLVVAVQKAKEENEGLGVVQGFEDLAAETGVLGGADGRASLQLLADVPEEISLDVPDFPAP